MFSIYHIILPNSKGYIGITTDIKKRFGFLGGKPSYKGYAECNPIMYKDILIYDPKNVKYEILGETENYEDALEIEHYWIQRHQTATPEHGYNHSVSGTNRSMDVHPYYKSEEYKRELQASIQLIEEYAGIRVSLMRDHHLNYHREYYHQIKAGGTKPTTSTRIKKMQENKEKINQEARERWIHSK